MHREGLVLGVSMFLSHAGKRIGVPAPAIEVRGPGGCLETRAFLDAPGERPTPHRARSGAMFSTSPSAILDGHNRPRGCPPDPVPRGAPANPEGLDKAVDQPYNGRPERERGGALVLWRGYREIGVTHTSLAKVFGGHSG